MSFSHPNHKNSFPTVSGPHGPGATVRVIFDRKIGGNSGLVVIRQTINHIDQAHAQAWIAACSKNPAKNGHIKGSHKIEAI